MSSESVEHICVYTGILTYFDLRLHFFAEAKFARILELFKKFPGESYKPSATTASSAYENIKNYNIGVEFEHIDISTKFNLQEPLTVSIRKNPLGVVKQMFASKEGQAVLCPGTTFDADGQRVFSNMWTADKWLNDQVVTS